MGSVNPVALENLPSTKLPRFNIYNPSHQAVIPQVHQATLRVRVPVTEPHHLLQRFARFVGDVSESEHVAFIADVPGQGRFIVQSTVLPHKTYANTPDVELKFVGLEEPQSAQEEASGIDYEIQTSTSGPQDGPLSVANPAIGDNQQRALALYIAQSRHDDSADITLSLRHDYGPSVAAKHLIQLAAAYLTSASVEEGLVQGHLQPSRVNFDTVLQSPPLVRLYDATSNGANGSSGSGSAVPRLLHSAFEENVRRRPDNIAIDYLSRTPSVTSTPSTNLDCHRTDFTYAELDTRATNLSRELGLLAQTLRDQWRPVLGDQVAFPVFIPPSPELFMTMLAALKSGHPFCSLPQDAPPERLRAIVEDLGSPVVLGVGQAPWFNAEGTQNEVNQLSKETIWVDINDPTSWRANRIIPHVNGSHPVGIRTAAEDDVSYLFYTSGSTGKPKGVLCSHRSSLSSVNSFISAQLSHLPTGPRLRYFSMSAPTFDPFIMDVFVTFSLGGVLCSAERDLLLTDVEAAVRELRATATFAVTSLALLMRPERMPTLKTLIVGGELLLSRVVEKFAPVAGTGDDRNLINGYGPTEATIFVTAESFTSRTRGSVIGDMLPTVFSVIVDPSSLDAGVPRETPLGLAGELLVGGPQVGRGYLNRPDVTERAFIPAEKFPALGLPAGATLYRTGDKARVVWADNGTPKIEYLGRIGTDQVKLNGRRVALTEIESVLAGAAGVAGVAVVLAPGAKLAAFLTTWAGEESLVVEERCRVEAEKLLPGWMRPAKYSILPSLPRTVGGKVDRKGLSKIAAGDGSSDRFNGPFGPLTDGVSAMTTPECPLTNGTSLVDGHGENSLPTDSVSIVYRGLVAALGDHVQDVGRGTSLLTLGLDSLRAMLFLQNMRAEGVADLSMANVLTVTTVNDLIRLVDGKNSPAHKGTMRINGNDKTAANGVCLNGHITEIATESDDESPVEIAKIPVDDEEAIYELSISSKLRHFAYHTRTSCEQALRLKPEEIEQVLPATNTQIRMLYISHHPELMNPTRFVGRPQVEHFVYDIPLDQLDSGRLQRAVDIVLERHDCFRAVFCRVEHLLAPFAMVILNKDSKRAAVPRLEIVCPYDPDESGLWQQTLISAQRAAETSMSPDRPGLTVTWIRSLDGDHRVMILSMFHGINDGVMLTHMREEIALEYAQPGRAGGIRSLTSKDKTLPLLQMRRTVELLLGGTDWVETMFYWMKRFAGVPTFRIGPHAPVPKSAQLPARAGSTETHMRSLALISRLSLDDLANGAAAQLSTTLAAVVQAAWASVLVQTRKGMAVECDITTNGAAQLQGKLDVQFGSILHGRHDEDLWRCMGPLLATVPMHLVLTVGGEQKNVSNRDICRLLAAQHAEASPHMQAPCPTLDLCEVGMNRFDTVLNLHAYRSATDPDLAAHDLPGWNPAQNLLPPYKEIDIGFPIMMEVWPAFGAGGPDWAGKMTLKCTYNVRRPGYEFLGEEWVAGLLGALDEALVRVLEEPDEEFYVG